MKLILIVISLCMAKPCGAQPPGCPCTPTTPKSRQQRTSAKHTAVFKNIIERKKFLSTAEMSTWQDRYDSLTAGITTTRQAASSKRMHNTPEDTMYTIKAYLWFVKLEHNDCDLHMELGTADSTDTRVIVELPAELKTVQAQLKKELQKRGLPILNCGTSNSNKAHYAKGIPVLVRGIGFYDASHKPDTNHGDSHTKKYSWELHPVVAISFL
jgi:hypothetical protein